MRRASSRPVLPDSNYNLYRDAARTQVWGNASSGTTVITGTAQGRIQCG